MKEIILYGEKGIVPNEMLPINEESEEFKLIMNIYKEATNQLIIKLNKMKEKINQIADYEVISKICGRVKSPQSIINKMQKKNYNMDYSTLINNINDIAGIRIICNFKDDIYKVFEIIRKMPNVEIIEEKDYLRCPKKSGYAAYHVIVELPVKILNSQIYVKAEIQIRTISMDFWATNEHKIKYKTSRYVSFIDSKKLTLYAKMLNFLDDEMMKIYRKQERI